MASYKSWALEKRLQISLSRSDAEKWKTDLDSIHEDFMYLVKLNHLKIISVSEASSPITMQANETQMGWSPRKIGTVVQGHEPYFALSKFRDCNEGGFQEMCRWLSDIFRDDLSHDSNWDEVFFTLKLERPFGEHWIATTSDVKEDIIHMRIMPWSHSDPDSSDFWAHFPANNETSMNVS